MIIAKYDQNNIITNIYSTKEFISFVEKLQLKENQYKVFFQDNINLKKGEDIRVFNTNGTFMSVLEQINLGILVLAENEILEGNIIRKLTEEELKEKFPDRYPTEKEEENQPKTLAEAVSEKEREIILLKDRYLDADLEDNEEEKKSLKVQILALKSELAVLQESLAQE